MKPSIKNKELIRSQAYVDGSWVNGAQGKTFPVENPFDQKIIAHVPDMGKKDAVQAVEAAYFALPAWSSLLPQDRARRIKKVADLVKSQAADLAVLLTLEQGKPLSEASNEIHDTVEVIYWLAEEAARIHGFTQGDPDGARSVMTIRQPIGVVAAIAPWNFPFSIAAQKGFAALAAGCTIVLKPAEDTPLTALALAFLTMEAEIPPGVFNVITCKKPEAIGEVLTTHPLVSKVTFTGSTEVGKKILAQSASTVKNVTLELGGNCPAIVFEDADLEKALRGIFDLKFYNAGQCCNSTNRIFVHQSIYEEFVSRFTAMTKELTIGNGLEAVNLGPLINQESKKKIEHLIQDAEAKGAEVITSKKKLKGLLCPPIVLKNCTNGMNVFSEEIFGPVASFYSFDNEDEAVAMANDTRYGLAAYFYTENLTRAMRVSKELEAGTVGINTTNVYSIMLPFGGWKESGLGREGGIIECLNDYCEVKAISIGT